MTDNRGKQLEKLSHLIKGIAVSSHFPIDRDLMMRLPHLQIIACCSVGYDYVDAEWAGKHGIIVTNTPGVLTDEVADTAIGLLLCTIRQFPKADRFIRAGQWEHKIFPLSKLTLRESKIGIVGMGRIGRAIAKRLEGFSIAIEYHSLSPKSDLPYKFHPTLQQMALAVDILINCTPGGDSTRNIIGAHVLKSLGSMGVLINIGRASSVDEKALISALRNGEIMAAGLDVYWNEPHVPKELMTFDNVVLLPHLGSATIATRQAMYRLVADNLIAWNVGRAPLTPVAENI